MAFLFYHSMGLIVLIFTFLYIGQHPELPVLLCSKIGQNFFSGVVHCPTPMLLWPENQNVMPNSNCSNPVGVGGGTLPTPMSLTCKLKCHSDPNSNFSYPGGGKYIAKLPMSL